jgi:sugar phosphate isomerase/epimerase
MATTRTGRFPIGFRRGWTDWQTKDLASLARWAKAQGFEAIDLGTVGAPEVRDLAEHGLRLGSADVLELGKMMDPDAGRRRDLVARNAAYVREAAAAGARVFFTCIIPGEPAAPRAKNYDLAVETFAPVAQACARAGAALAVEGWPGSAPYLANLCCTPETVRSFLTDVGPGAGINYDPSHLIRLGVDHLRFLREFLPHVKHVHAKDTVLFPEAQYEFGTQAAAFAKARDFGEWTWRYAIPGRGAARWGEIFSLLEAGGFGGIVSIELEDEEYCGTEDGEKAGLLASLAFLRGA